MRLYESEAKRLLVERGVRVPRGGLARSAGEAGWLALDFDAVAVKSQVLHGGRMKAGLIRFAEGEADARMVAKQLFDVGVTAQPVTRLLVEQRLPVEDERFLAALYDPRRRAPVLVYGPCGGIDVEQENYGSIERIVLDPRYPTAEFKIRSGLRRAGVSGEDLCALTEVAVTVARMLFELDATLVEINPLARISGQGWVAIDAHIELDSDALVRHRQLVERFSLTDRGDGARSLTPVELHAREIDGLDDRGVAGRLVQFDGEIALIIGGGGASLTVFDAVRDAGGRPANYCEVGGNPTVAKVARFTGLLLNELKAERIAVISDVISNTRADLIARGVILGCLNAGRAPAQTIAVFRVPGAWELESRELLADHGITALGRETSIDVAARLAVQETFWAS